MKKWNGRMLFLYVVSFFAAGFSLGTDSMIVMHPLAVALFGCLYLEQRLPAKLSFLVLLGGVAAGNREEILRYGITLLTLFFVAEMASRMGRKKLELVPMAALGGIITAAIRASGGVFALEDGSVFLALAEGVLTFGVMVVLEYGVHFLLYSSMESKTMSVSGREMIGTSLLLLGALCGLPQLPGDYNAVLSGAILAMLYLGYSYGIGAGTVVGALAGAVLGIHTGNMELAGCFALCSLISCVMRELGKIPVILTWMMASVSAGFLWNDYFLERNNLIMTLPAAVIFMLLPGRKEEQKELPNPIVTNMQTITRERLRELSQTFSKLSELMAYPVETETGLTAAEHNRIFHQVTERCCADCEKRHICMKTEFFETYHLISQMLSLGEKDGILQSEEIPEAFLTRCIRAEYFLLEIERNLELARTNLIWRNRMAESRTVVAQQFAGVAGMVDEVVTGLRMMNREPDRFEEKVRDCLRMAGIEFCQVAVERKEDGRLELFLTVRMPEGECITTRDLAGLLGKTIGRQLHATYSSKTVISNEWATISFIEDTTFCFYSGVAACSREGEPRSGDSHSVRELPQGEAVLLLSDGMGSGTLAAAESGRMVELLEQLLDAGMDSLAAMKLIQSSMLLREEGERFTTVDLFRINLCTGDCRYMKVGAADSFLVRGEQIERLTYSCLPAGILPSGDTQEQEIHLLDGDFLVMVTDGFLDCFEEGQVEEILRSVIGRRKQNNAGELARVLLDSALIHCGGSPMDDITVLVTGFWGNRLASRGMQCYTG